MTRSEIDDLAAELEDFAPRETAARDRVGERIRAGFEDVVRFVEAHGREPSRAYGADILEQLLAVRLDRLRALPEAREMLAEADPLGLLRAPADAAVPMDDNALAAALSSEDEDDIHVLRHVRPTSIQRAEDVAKRVPCRDFEAFAPAFQAVQAEIKDGRRKTLRFGGDGSVEAGNWFVLGGQLVLVAKVGETFQAPNGAKDARLRVIYANGTESDLLMRSLQRALWGDETGRRVSESHAGPLFGDAPTGAPVAGMIYVLRSHSKEPIVERNRDLLHKIGVTTNKVETRIANAENDATYLLASVEVVATWSLIGVDPVKLENLLHRFFAPGRVDIEIKDRFGKPVHPREWFLVPLDAIDEAVRRVRDGSITDYVYDRKTARLVPRTKSGKT